VSTSNKIHISHEYIIYCYQLLVTDNVLVMLYLQVNHSK